MDENGSRIYDFTSLRTKSLETCGFVCAGRTFPRNYRKVKCASHGLPWPSWWYGTAVRTRVRSGSVTKGTMTIEKAAKAFKRANTPAATAKHAQERYEKHHRRSAGDKTFVPRKSYNMVPLPERTLVRTAVPYHQEGHGRPWDAHLTFR